MLDLYAEAFDWPLEQPTRKRYFILSTPRVGSTLLGHLLSQLPGAGRPLEYLNTNHRNRLSNRWNAKTTEDYASRLLAFRTSPGGWFGLKLHVTQALNNDGSVQELFALLYAPDSPIICLTRQNKVAQAVSFVHASQTGHWASHIGAKATPAMYDRLLIEKTIGGILRLEQRRDAFLAMTHTGPRINLLYERLAEAPADAVRDVARCLNVEVPRALGPGPKPVESDLKREWVTRYESGK